MPLPAAQVAAVAAAAGIPAHPAATVGEAVSSLASADRLLICGSLHLAGAVLAENG